MCSKIPITTSTENYSDNIRARPASAIIDCGQVPGTLIASQLKLAKSLIDSADAVVIGVGSGLTAAGGLCYTDQALVKKWYPEYYRIGLKSIVEIQSAFWRLDSSKPEQYWGYWARHIWHIRYEAETLKPYQDLFSLISGKEHFIVTTNVDGQLVKAGFTKENIFAPQGDYALFQCQTPCRDEVFDNREMIETMINNMPNAYEIRTEDIPKCPHCGKHLVPNLRCDDLFVETPHVQNMDDYTDFINSRKDRRIVFLELGVGFNTPGIIRFPFEHMTMTLPDAVLIRINNSDANVVHAIKEKAVCIKGDLAAVLDEMTNSTPN